MSKKVLIIGMGLGGLSTALRLNSKGYEVEMVEKYHQPGGRLNVLQKDGFTFDTGPSFFSMTYEFDELFNSCGLENPLEFEPLEPLYRVFFRNGGRVFDVHKNLDKLAKEFEDIEPHFREQLDKYLKSAGKLFHGTENVVVKQNFKNKLHYLTELMKVPPSLIPYIMKNMWANLEQHFQSEEARTIFSLVAFFLGSAPFKTPALYSLLNYTELKHNGYYALKGGMYDIVRSIMPILEQRGVKFHYGVEIADYHYTNNEISSFTDKTGKQWTADIFVANADAAGFRNKVMNRQKYSTEKLDKMEWTLAPFCIYLGIDRKLDNIVHHNYFLGDNFKEYSDKIFTSPTSPDRPYYYVNAGSKSDPGCAPEGCENLFILCPVPDLRYKKSWDDKESLADSIIADLSKRVGVDLNAHTLTKTIRTPQDWEDNFNLYRGSGLGLAHGLWQVGAFRPANTDEEFKNLFYVGASTTPGTGLPMVVISSKLTTQRIMALK